MSFADAFNQQGGGGFGGGMQMGGGEVDELSRESKAVASMIFQMTTNVSSFKRLVDTLGTAKDTRELRTKLQRQREAIGQMAKDASLAVKRLAQAVQSSSDSGNKSQHVAQHQKLVKDFHVVLKEFQKAQRTCAERESTYLPQREQGSGSMGQRFVHREDHEPSYQNSETYEEQALLQEQQRQDLIKTEGDLEFNNALIEEREQGIVEIQQQIGEVNEIFQDLAVLVNEQGHMIDDIEANIVSTAVRTKDAQRELTKADKSQKAARNKMICLAIVVAVVLIVLILFLLQG